MSTKFFATPNYVLYKRNFYCHWIIFIIADDKNIAYKLINTSCTFLMPHFDQLKLAIGQKGRKAFLMNKEGNITLFQYFILPNISLENILNNF